ncbi:calmodulin-binding transcription activator 2 isoform X2 [Folsomia candida]|uniref:calmodulin-binding transcription activator 2 isoform X2 n=1 Tax=Folsomia candida TaxID=158441 RepID=UPI001604A1E0|nr:calmodulin-binding transcription activator 2 isoform X2 [Folsomia candida]
MSEDQEKQQQHQPGVSPPSTFELRLEENIDPDNPNRNCANNCGRRDCSCSTSATDNNRISTPISGGCASATQPSSSAPSGGGGGPAAVTATTGSSSSGSRKSVGSDHKSPSASSSRLTRKSNNNANHSISKPSFPSLVIALLNTVRTSGGGGGASTVAGAHLTKAGPVAGDPDDEGGATASEKPGDSSNSNANLNLKMGNKNTNGLPGPTADDENGNETPTGENGESAPAIKLPENLEGLMRADHFPCQRHRWNSNEEIAAILISFAHHPEWLSKEVKIRPKSGSMLLYSRKKVRYRRDGYCWKKRKDGKTTREDHMKLKVQGTECIYGCYVHSAILPTFHRRCYWLLQNPDIVLVAYLNVPYPDDNKLIITSNVSLWGDKKEWTKEELISQLKPMFFSEEEPDLNNELELSTAETVEAIVMQLMEKQRLARQAICSGDTLTASGPNSNSSSSNHVVSSNSSVVGTTGSTTTRLSSSSSTSSLVQLTNGGPSIVATVTTNQPHNQGQVGHPATNSIKTEPGHQIHQTTNGTTRLATAVMTTAGSSNGHHHGSQDRPFLLNLSQFQTTGGLIILNGKPTVTTTSGGGVGVTQNHSASVQATHHSALAAVQNLNGNASLTSTLSFMDVQNANESVVRVPSTSSNQTLLIHHTQSQQHFATAVASAHPHQGHGAHPHQNHHHQQLHHHPSQSQQQHTVHHPPHSSGSHVTQVVNHVGPSPGDSGGGSGGGGGGGGGASHQELLTLEMSHEDIQQTLSANMGMGDSGGDLEPMSPSADDVFVNLDVDAFDILADLSDDLDQSHHNGVLMGVVTEKTTIVDINPEWAYSEGGTKVFIVGQFHNPHWEYSVHFGDLPVPAVYLQAGVLKCFCPPHSPGLVPIRVYIQNGKQISNNSMVFEYKADMKMNLVPVPPSEASLKLCLIHRMECFEKCFQNFNQKGEEYGSRCLEDSVVKMCVEMMSQEWTADASSSTSLLLPISDRGLTLLHLAAALGYTRLLLTLIQWKRENPAPILHAEVDPWKSDDFGLIPLAWAAREGSLECGIILSQWSPDTLQKRDSEGLNPAQIAVNSGHVKLASELEKIQNNKTSSEFGFSLGFTMENISLTSNLRRFQRCSEDFGLKDCFFGHTTSELSLASEEDSKVLTLAEQIIKAIPDRIKKESSEEMSPCDSQDSSMVSSDPSDSADFSFEFSDRNYRYYDSATPGSSLSPSSSCLQSPCSSSFTVDSPQPTTADFCEFLHASAFEKDFSNLTLTDREQRELYEAAKVIQKAYRSYKGRKKMEEEEKEKVAAVIIQNYYRRYKQYAYLRQVTQAALVIQSQYRNYCEHKRFKKSQETGHSFRMPRDSHGNSTHPILRTYSQRRQNQAAKKIQQFMRQSKNNFWECDESPKITERACRSRKREAATIALSHGGPAPAKIALSSVHQKKALRQQKLLSSAF